MDASSKKRKAPGTSAKPKASSKAATGSVKALAKDDDGDWTDSEQERKLETRRPTVATSLKKLKASRSSAKHNVIPKVAINKIQATVVGGDVTRDLVDTETAPGGRINEIFKAAVAKLGSHANANPGSYIGLTQLAQDFFVFGCQKVPANHQPGLSELIKEAIPKYLGYSNDKTAQRGYVEKSVFEVLKTKPHTFYYRFPNKQYLELPDELVKLKLRVLLATTCSLLPADQRNALKPAAMLTAKSIAKAGVKGFNEYVAAAPQIPSNKVNFDKCYVFTPNHACGIEEDAAGPLRQYISNHAVECHEAVDGNAFLDQALLNLKKDGERTRFYYSLFTDKLAKNRYYVELPNEHVKTKLAARFDSFICHNRIASSKSHKSSAQEASPNQTATEVAAEAVAAKPKSRKHPRCRIEGCFKQARPGKTGLCLRHGANSILCTVPDCTSQAGDNSGGMCDDHYNARAQGQVNGDESTPEEPPAPKKPPAKKKQVAKDDVTAEEWAAWRNESSTSVVPEHGLPVLSIPNFDISSATASRANGTSILNVSATEQRDGSNTPSAVGLAAGASSTGNRLKDTSNSNTPPRQRVHASNAIGTPNKAQPSSDHVSTPVVNRNQAIEVKTPQPPEIPLPGPDAELYHIANGRSAV